MNVAMIIIAAAGFAISIFPIHVFNYIYINTEEKYASINVTIFRFIRIFNANTIKNKPGKMQINGKEKKMDYKSVKLSFYKIFNMLCIQKVIQLSDYGVQNEQNAYAALAQNGVTTAAYKFLQINGNCTKLRNYTILNEEHSSIRYYAKAVTVINLLVVTKIILYILMEKINERKN
ncbi:MAG: hypothetical protein K2N22_03680 [Clostridia bacterium]|nr:hypothetical protein [Clostridia bacterium]